MRNSSIDPHGGRTRACVLRRNLLLAATGAGLALTSGAAWSQVLEEVIVTAQKRETGLQETPVAVSSFTGDDLQAFNMENSKDIAAKTPNLYMVPSGGGVAMSQVVYIRGQGQNAVNITVDPSIGTYIDGIYVAKDSGSLIELVDLERIEVLKGPQGTLYGRNTTGGAIKFHSVKPDPTDDFGGWVRANTGNFGKVRMQGAVNIPLSDTFALRYAGSYHDRDGYTTTYFLDRAQQPVARRESDDLKAHYHRLNALWEPTDSVTVFASGYYVDAEINGHLNRNLSGDTVGAAGFGFYSDDFYEGALSATNAYGQSVVPEGATDVVEGYGLSVDVTWATPLGFEAQGIVSHRSNDLTASNFDVEGTAWPFLNVNTSTPQDFESTAAELQFKGLALDSRMSWLTGIYYFEEQGDDGTHSYFFTGTPPGIYQRASGGGDNESFAVFGHLTFDLTHALSVDAGLRWTKDKKGLTGGNLVQPQGVPFPLCLYNPAETDVANTTGRVGGLVMAGDTCEFTPSETWGYWSWNVGAQYHFSDNLMAYVKTNRAQRAGGHQFRDVSGEFPPFDEEVLTDIEAGIKTEWFDNRVRLNLAGFISDYEDYQYTIQASTSLGTITTATVNFGDAEVRGAEVDLVALIAADLSFQAGAGWAKIDYEEPGFQHFNMPEYSGYLSLSYHPSYGFGDGLAQVNWSFRGETEKEVSKTVAARLAQGAGSKLDAYQLLDARVGVTLNNGWEVHLWGRNLTKKKYYKDALNLNGAFVIGYIGEPRTYGLEVGYSW